jgi:hypothetical protein
MMSNFENPEQTNHLPTETGCNEENFMTIGEAIGYMCEQLGRISRTSFYRCGYRKMLTVRSYGRNIQNGRKAIKLCRKSEVDDLITLIRENPQAENL